MLICSHPTPIPHRFQPQEGLTAGFLSVCSSRGKDILASVQNYEWPTSSNAAQQERPGSSKPSMQIWWLIVNTISFPSMITGSHCSEFVNTLNQQVQSTEILQENILRTWKKEKGLIGLWGISMSGKWKEWEGKGKTHRQTCKPHTCDHITCKSLNTWHIQSFICGLVGHRMIRHFNQSGALYPSATLARQLKKIIANNTNKLFILHSCLKHGTTVSSHPT